MLIATETEIGVMSRRRDGRRGLALLLLAIAFVFASAPAVVKATSPTASPSAEAAVAVAVAVPATGYAGDCAATVSPNDLGKVCSKLVAQQGNVQAYLVGRAFSEFTEWVFVEQVSTGWYPLSTSPYNDSAQAIPWPPLPAG